MNPAKAAASAPIPNQSSTKPDVKISATISIAPRMHHKIQNQSFISTLREILQHEPHIRRTLSEPAHEVRIPVFSVRNIDSHVVTIPGELMLKIPADTVEHLKLELFLPDPFARGKFNRRIDHLRIVRGDAVIDTTAQ